MQLYKQISTLNHDLKASEGSVLQILKDIGAYSKFTPFISENFVKFVFYFVHAYSFDSEMMDTKTFTASLKTIEKNFDFDLDSFRVKIGEEFEEKYLELIQWYLEVQRNRDFELLMSGQILYKQMISASTSRAIFTKSKAKDEDNKGIETIDYDLKHDLFLNCLSLNEKLSVLEEKLSSSSRLIQEATGKRIIDLKIENY